MNESTLRRILEPIQRRIYQIVGRAVIQITSDEGAIQKAQVGITADETLNGIDRVQEYGFTSRPLPGAQAVVVCVTGDRGHPVIIATDDGRYRLKLENGEACLYDDQGQFVKIAREKIDINTSKDVEITAGGNIKAQATQIEAQASEKITATAPEIEVVAESKVTITSPSVEVTGDLSVTGTVEITGDVDVTGGIVASGDVEDSSGSMADMRSAYNLHVHNDPLPTPNPQM